MHTLFIATILGRPHTYEGIKVIVGKCSFHKLCYMLINGTIRCQQEIHILFRSPINPNFVFGKVVVEFSRQKSTRFHDQIAFLLNHTTIVNYITQCVTLV